MWSNFPGGSWPVENWPQKACMYTFELIIGSSFFDSWDAWQDNSIRPRQLWRQWLNGRGRFWWGWPLKMFSWFSTPTWQYRSADGWSVDHAHIWSRWSTPASRPSDLQDQGPADSNATIFLPNPLNANPPAAGQYQEGPCKSCTVFEGMTFADWGYFALWGKCTLPCQIGSTIWWWPNRNARSELSLKPSPISISELWDKSESWNSSNSSLSSCPLWM